ncbi:RNA ligase (ATP) [Actinomadura kijaniata]|uniref:RNA ligase (TIGR02306 family) n=1 Tax=Actinomadura namibiensis TaxID=182080 RepID=A0A7W3LS12_ACTNM|nr:RNA ligase (ATP) [Actinomadura namibiensis]MBA8953296.1 RNA ligase (TIGR02306 family) [Actinomadura namibiensis]
MSTLRVTAERLTIHPHDNADALELAQVGLYRAVVAKGQYRTGDWALYIPEGALLPDDLIAELGLTGRLAGSGRDRVKAVRLRGELSQGIVCVPAAVRDVDLATAHAEGRDFAGELGVTKWVPPIPVHMAGEVVAAPDLVPWIEIEDVKRYPALFEAGEPVVATEKIHGTACAFTLAGGEAFVSSKGFSAKRMAIRRDPANLYWRAVETHGVPEAAQRIAALLDVDRVAVFGEVYGRGVQDLAYGADGKSERPGYAVFDVAVSADGGSVRWLDADETARLLGEVGLPAVPRLYEGPFDTGALMELASGRETVSGSGAHLREGLVVRPAVERYSPVTGGRAIGKFVSPAYLTRKGGTEYE